MPAPVSISGDLGAGGTGGTGEMGCPRSLAVMQFNTFGFPVRQFGQFAGQNTSCYSVLGSRPMIGSRRIWQHPPARMSDIGICIPFDIFRLCPSRRGYFLTLKSTGSLPGTVISSRRTCSGRLARRIGVTGRDCSLCMPSRRWHRTDSGPQALKLAVELHPLGNIAGSEKRRSGEV